MLYIIPTPIGNLKDITVRALDVLKEVDLILAEDTRQTKKLLNHYEINTSIDSFHQHNEHKKVGAVIDKLVAGISIAQVSDAGTPGISDPGFLLIRECIKSDIKVECLPGATAFVPALVKSGLPCDKFVFEGFLPHKKGRQTRLKELATETRTIIFYESPYRLVKTLKQLAEFFEPNRQASVSRELTKIYEETKNGTLTEIAKYYEEKGVKGEIVLIVKGAE
ncbi:MAG: 16S rRNA (cytidine(1402)-2'-O)-methyltransferase [Flavobacteriales bacterium]|nr:16S rRNA (cytidine(1402)-2'-O)-methyltransferase [Flavobacteriales bacterium]